MSRDAGRHVANQSRVNWTGVTARPTVSVSSGSSQHVRPVHTARVDPPVLDPLQSLNFGLGFGRLPSELARQFLYCFVNSALRHYVIGISSFTYLRANTPCLLCERIDFSHTRYTRVKPKNRPGPARPGHCHNNYHCS